MKECMFCFQCQETAKNTGCTLGGVCGKKPETANRMATNGPLPTGSECRPAASEPHEKNPCRPMFSALPRSRVFASKETTDLESFADVPDTSASSRAPDVSGFLV